MNTPQNASPKVKFGIIGTNTIVDKVLDGARLDPRFELTALYSRTQEQADLFAKKHNIPRTFTSLEEMVVSPDIDAVYIASPNSCHAQQSIMCMEHGKHVLCEKPFASNAYEVREMIAASKKYNVTLMEAMKPTVTPNFQILRDHLEKLGTIRRYFSSYCKYSSRYDDLKEGIVINAFKNELSNGAVMDIGIYCIYPMVVLFGRPKTISATGLKLYTDVDGQGAVNFEYEGLNATVIYSKISDSLLPTEIQGEAGTIQVDKIGAINSVLFYDKEANMSQIGEAHTCNEYYYEIAEFIDLIEQKKIESSINSHENSLITIEIIDEIRRQVGIVYPADKI